MANPGSTTALKKLARRLLTTTCLTVAASASAHAGLLLETSAPGSDFPGSFGAAYVLPAGTTEVQGSLASPTDNFDFFEFTGLLGGTAYSFANTYGGGGFGLNMEVLNSSQSVLNAYASTPASFSGTIPGDGALVVEMFLSSGEGVTTYDTTLTAQSAAPEPGTLGTLGLALAGALTLRRKRSK
jgi:PEP-CTERM motif